MSLIDGFKGFFSRSRCEKLIKYQARLIEFKSVGGEIAGAKISLGDFKTDTRKVHEATSLAKALDDYQYIMCTMAKDLKKRDPDWKTMFKQRAAVISLLTALRGTLIAFKINPSGQKKNFNNIIKTMQELINVFARETVQAKPAEVARASHYKLGHMRGETGGGYDRIYMDSARFKLGPSDEAGRVGIKRHRAYIRKPDTKTKRKHARTISKAFKLAGVNERKVDQLTKEFSGSIHKKASRVRTPKK